jgi:carbon monoxide dehydrogenase subunit G
VIRVELTLEIERSPHEVFDRLVDIDRVPEWQSSAVRSHADGPMRVGARVHEARRLLGREAHSELEVCAFDPPRHFALRTVSGPVKVDVDHELEAQRNGTVLHVVAEADPGSILRLAKPVLARQAEHELRTDFGRLKELLENEA